MAQNEQINDEERYQYIGFESFGKKVKPFWKNNEERAEHLKKLHELESEGTVFRKSVVMASVMGLSDRIAIAVASLIMIVAPFLPWIKADTIYGPVSFTGFTGLMHLDSFWFYVELMGGKVIPVAIYLTAAVAYLSIFFGIVTLVVLFMKAKSIEAYAKRLKSVLRLQIYPFLIFLAIIIVSLIGQRIPFGEYLGIYGLGDNFNMVTFLSFTSFGLWLAIFGFLLNFNKSKEL